jgi:hypothetical protein
MEIQMTITQIENSIKKIIKNFSQDTFVFEFLLAYGEPKATITRLQKADLNQLESKGELTLRKKLFFKVVVTELHGVIDSLRTDISTQKQKPRFIIVTDYKTLLAYDTKTTDTLDISFTDLTKHYDFFLPLAGMEKSTHVDENPADVKASNQLAKLYDEILKNNPTQIHEEVHALNVFLTRLLFCYFAEDSNIFDDNLFTASIASHTQVDGSDVDSYLDRLFDIFNTADIDRDDSLPQYLKDFPYVNGGLFRTKQPLPKFTTKSRNILIDIGGLDWSEINPDIFGSMIQAVVTPEHRGDMGMHYTSVPNIIKVMQPLFLDELYEEFKNIFNEYKPKIINLENENKNLNYNIQSDVKRSQTIKKSLSQLKSNYQTKLLKLHQRIASLKIFDPACGSGNFLIIAYKELRQLEMKILKERNNPFSEIKLTQFYGIELDDFAHEVAILSLWLAEHQMNLEFYKAFGRTAPSLPLQDGGNIVHGNATRIDWENVCPKNTNDEIYILGNPPYLGSKNQNDIQKQDMEFNFRTNFKTLDYIACWFYKGARYIENINSKYAFVTTNSICQGEQVSLLWPQVLSEMIEIQFAYQSFKWKNNAKGNAGVTVAIVGLSNKSKRRKYIYNKNIKSSVERINPYLVNADTIYISSKRKPFSNFPNMIGGNVAYDSGHLIFSEHEMNNFISKEQKSKKWFRKLMGGKELLNGGIRYCLWFKDIQDINELNDMPLVIDRIEKVKQARLSAKDKGTHRLAERSHQFRDLNNPVHYIAIPKTSSERREYIPMGYLDNTYIPSDSIRFVENAEPYHFGVLTSKLHMAWMKLVAGKLKTDYRYSKDIVYNTFPFPVLSEQQKEEITNLVFNILDEREQHSEKTLAQLYDPDKMPQDLKEAHHQLDLAIEKCYRNKPFENDEERLEYLFKLYEEMIEENK